MKKAIIIFLLFINFFSLHQNGYSQKNEKKAGYNISIQLLNSNENILYLVSYSGGDPFIIDSAFSNKGVYTFKSKKSVLESGIYSIQTSNNQNLFDILIDKQRNFKIKTDISKPLHYISILKSEENIQFFEYQKAVASFQDLIPFLETSPNSLLSKYVKAKHFPITETYLNDTTLKRLNLTINEWNKYILKHYYDHIDFKDKRLYRTPLKINYKYYFSDLFSQMELEEQELFEMVNNFLDRTIDTNIRPIDFEVQYFYLQKLMKLYMNNTPQFDTLFVYLHDHYFDPSKDQWAIFDESYNRVFSMVADRKRKSMTGRVVDPIIAYDMNKQAISSQDIQSDYTIIWFWDPDCEHCISETPILHDFYTQNHIKLNFEVIAVSVTEDYERWVKFIKDHHLDWINLSYSMGEPNYDFLDFFDLTSTPGVFLIDKNHKIIGRQISLDKIQKILESKLTTVQ